MKKVFFTKDLDEINVVAKQITNLISSHKKVAFYGEMGVGKTTLIKALSLHLGVKDVVSSPTFSIVNEYQANDAKIYHFDFYRIEDEQEAYDMGYEEYFYSNNYCFIEWPERIKNLIEDEMISINITLEKEEKRKIEVII